MKLFYFPEHIMIRKLAKNVRNLIVSPSFSCSSSFLQFESTIDEIFIRQNSNPYSQLFLASSSQKSLSRGGKVFVEYKFPTTNLTYSTHNINYKKGFSGYTYLKFIQL